ncbi:MAG: 4-(cytidine 5'-diphospho)-2-C-methyl-D-erythritol kinase [Chitinophagaceae bacterium]
MIAFPNCKINLGLNIINKRSDGYHNLETVFLPIDLKDILELIRIDSSDDPSKKNNSINFFSSGIAVTDNPADNICLKAYQLLQNDFSQLNAAVRIHLHKIIPAGAGLGGGSADGAFMLQLLNKKFNLGLSTEQLLAYTLQLGSDCPFFIYNKPCFASGRGEKLETIGLDLSAYKILIVNPGIHISTANAFSN